MFDRHYRFYSRFLLAADAFAVIPALALAYYARYYLVKFAPMEISRLFNPELLPFGVYLAYVLIFLPAWFFLLLATQRYPDLLRRRLGRQWTRLVNFFLLSGSLMGLLTFSLKLEISRPVFFAFFASTVVLLPLNRVLLYWFLSVSKSNEFSQVRILIVGTGKRARSVGRILGDAQKWGYRVVGHIRMNGDPEEDSDLEVLGVVEDLPRLLQEEHSVDEVIFTGAGRKDVEQYEDVIGLCQELGIRTRVAADLIPSSSSEVYLEFLDGLPLITFASVPDISVSLMLKRCIDLFVAATALLVFFPVMLAVAFAIKLTSPGPVFYRQIRCGLFGREFALTKFRTMIDGAEDRLWEIRHLNEMDGPVFKMRDDPRVTPLGRFLRKASLDELPQFWNVLKGEMSIVGPRAPLPEEVQHYSIRQRRRLSVKPGITCLWQVSGRSNISFERWMDMDLEYIDNWSVWLDLVILLKTIPAVFTGRGAR